MKGEIIRKGLVGLLVGILVLGLLGILSADELLQNGGFEAWTGGLPDNWYGDRSNIGTSKVVEYTTAVHGGSKACQLIDTSTSHKRFTTQAYTIIGGVEYTLTYWVRGHGDIRNAFYRNGAYSGYSGYTSVNSTDWTQITYTFSYETTCSDCEIIFSVRSTNEDKDYLQIDDASCTYTSPGNQPPNISNVTCTPDVPNDTEKVVISAQITDDGSVAKDSMFYKINFGGFTPTSHDSISNSTYYYHIDPQNNYDTVYYYIWAIDNEDSSSVSDTSHYVVRPYVTGATTMFNEIRANSAGDDTAEIIELVGKAGTDITGYEIKHYNQTSAYQWTDTVGSFTIPDDGVTDNQGNPIGFYVLGCAGFSSDPNIDENTSKKLQNGPDDFVVLYDNEGNILDAVAWGGVPSGYTDLGLTTRSDCVTANNYLHVTKKDENSDSSLQAPDNVVGDDGSGWYLSDATIGAINANQTSGDVSLPVELSSLTAAPGDGFITLHWRTESEVNVTHFNIKRSTSRYGEFSLVKKIEAHGNAYYYSWTDERIKNGTTYWYELQSVGVEGMKTLGKVSATPGPYGGIFLRSYPNPFRKNTVISYQLSVIGDKPITDYRLPITLNIYDLSGRLIRILTPYTSRFTPYEVTWDGRDNKGKRVEAGIYFCILKTDTHTLVNKLILIK